MYLHDVDVKVLLSEAHLCLLQDTLTWTHRDADLLQALLIHVGKFQDANLLRLKVRQVFLWRIQLHDNICNDV